MKQYTTLEEVKAILESHCKAYDEITHCIGFDGITEEGKEKMRAISKLLWYTAFCENLEDLAEAIMEDEENLKEEGIRYWIVAWLAFNTGIQL